MTMEMPAELLTGLAMPSACAVPQAPLPAGATLADLASAELAAPGRAADTITAAMPQPSDARTCRVMTFPFL
jgi:hypothetical protein